MEKPDHEKLILLAQQARMHAHAPYSNFKVGAVVECRNGRKFTGCNVENSSYGLTICAERVAITKAYSEGERDIVRIAVVAEAHAPVPPCGACRQIIYELCGPETEIVMVNLEGRIEIRSAGELLPSPFDRSFL